MEISEEVLIKPAQKQQLPFVILRNHCTTPFTIVRAKHQGPLQKKLYRENKYNALCGKDDKQNAKPNMIFRKFKGIHKNHRKLPQFFSPKKLLQQKLYQNRLVQSDYEYCSGSSQGQISNLDHSLHSSGDYLAVFSTQDLSNNKYFGSPFFQLDTYQKSFSQKSSPQMSCNQLDFYQHETKDLMTYLEGANVGANSCSKKSIFSHYKDPNGNLNPIAFSYQNSQNKNNCDNLQQPQNSVNSQQPIQIDQFSFTQKMSQISQQDSQSSNTHCLDKVADQIQKLNLNLQSHNTSPSSQTNQPPEMQSISLFNNNSTHNSKSQQLSPQNQINNSNTLQNNSELPKDIESQILSLNMNNLQEIMLYNQKIKEKQIQEEYIKKQLYLVQQQQMVEEKYQQEMQNQKIEQEISKQKLESLKEQQKLQQQLHLQMILQQKQQQALQLQKQQFLQQKLLQQQQQQQVSQNLQQKIQQDQKTNQQIQLQMVQLINNLKAKGVQVTQEQLIMLVKNHSLKMQQQQQQQLQQQQQQQQLQQQLLSIQNQQKIQHPSLVIQGQNNLLNQNQQNLKVMQNNLQQQVSQQQNQIQQQQQQQQSPKIESSLEYIEDQEFGNNEINDEQGIFIQNYSKNMDEEFLELSNNQNSYGSNNLNSVGNNNNNESVNNNNEQYDFEMMLDDLIQLKSPTKIDHYSIHNQKASSPAQQANTNIQLEISQKIESPLKKHKLQQQKIFDVQQQQDFEDNNHSEQFKFEENIIPNLDNQLVIPKMENTHYNSFENLEDDDFLFMQNNENSNSNRNNMILNVNIKRESSQQKIIANSTYQNNSEGQTNMFKNEQIKQSIIQKVQSAIKQNSTFQNERKFSQNSSNSSNMMKVSNDSSNNFNNYQQ